MSPANVQARFTPERPCPICGGWDRMLRGRGERCHGYLGSDGLYAHCSRDEHAGELPQEKGGTFAHRLNGECRCGREHGPAELPHSNGKPKSSGPARGRIVATYDYRDVGGELVFQAVRFEPKRFAQRRPDPSAKGGWAWDLKGVEPVPYRLPELLAGDPSETVWIPEGEKDVEALVALGLVATCNPMGAEKWRDAYSPQLKGRRVVVLADNDDAGRRHAEAVARSVAPHAASIKVLDMAAACEWLELGKLSERGDVSDFLRMGGTLEDLCRLAAEAPAWVPPPAREGVSRVLGVPAEGVPQDFSGPPRPVVTVLRPVPEFRLELLPMPLRAWIGDIAERMQCAAEFPSVGALVSLSTLVGRKIGIRPKRNDNWLVVPNLWGMVVGRPGVLKTPGLQESKRPLERLVAQARDLHSAAMEGYRRDLLIAQARREAAKEGLKRAAKKPTTSDAEMRRLAESAAAEPDLAEPHARRYLTNDPSVEKLGELLRDNPNGIMLFRDELQGFLRTLDKQGHEADRAFYLEGWNGTGSFTCDRIGRGTVHIEAVCLSLLGGIQPGPLASYVRAATGAGDDGLISRFQLAVYPDQDRPFKIVDREPDAGAKNRAYDVFKALDSMTPADVGATVEDDSGIACVRFARDAQEFFYEWWADLETNKLRAGETPAIESHLAKYRSLMPSLALLFHLVDLVDPQGPGKLEPVSLLAARQAAAWCDLLEEHARRIYRLGTDGDMMPARTLAERIAESLPEPFTVRDAVQKGWTKLSTTEDVERALGVLEDHGWVRGVESPPGPGRPTVHYYTNPELRRGQP